LTTLHIVPHTHWDREWYLPFQTMRIKLVHLVDLLLRVLRTHPDYLHFTLDGQTMVAEDYLQIRPEQREEIVKHIAGGRLLIGPWTILPDEFLVSPESLLRNLQRGTRVAGELGGRMDVGYVPDPFGHVGQLPQILRGFGIESAALRRGLSDEPCELWWEAPDGSRVLLTYLRDGYDNAARLPTEPEAFLASVSRRGERLEQHSSVSHRLLLNGTDHHEPQAELPAMLRTPPPDGDRWVLSSLPAYLEAVRDEVAEKGIDLPVVRGELRSPKRHHLLPGVLSSRVWIKQRNDRCERLLERWAEPFLSWADHFCGDRPDFPVWTGQVETPRLRGAVALLAEAWRILLLCQPHDSICGCSVDAVHEEMRSRFDQVEQIAEEISRQSLVALADVVNTAPLERQGARRALVVFNAAPTTRSDLARVSLQLGAGLDPFEVVDPEGHVLPHRVLGREEEELANLVFEPRELQPLVRGVEDGWVVGLAIQQVEVERRGSTVHVELVLAEAGEPDMQAVRVGFEALEALLADPELTSVRLRVRFATRVDFEVWVPDLPAHGYRSLGLRPAPSESPSPATDGGVRIQNEWLTVEASPDGTVTLNDTRTGCSLQGLLRLRDHADRGDSYTFCPVDGEEPIEKPPAPARIRRERGPCGEVLEIEQTLRVPRRLTADRTRRADEGVELPVLFRIELVPGVPRADVTVELDNTAEDHRLQILFPIGAPVREAAYDGHYEIVRRPTEVPEGGPDWEEAPTPEQPMRTFVAAQPADDPEAPGLLVAVHGLREASVAPDGTLALTLLRCFGWLSRDDLSTRSGPAGPTVPVPGGQCPGRHRFQLSLIPFTGDLEEAARIADAFQTQPRGVGTALHAGPLPARASFLEVEPASFRLSAVCPGTDGSSVIVRGVWSGAKPGEVELRPLTRPFGVERIRPDEAPLGPVTQDESGTLRVPAGPHEIVSIRLSYPSAEGA
jgi:alpha-mannosidase